MPVFVTAERLRDARLPARPAPPPVPRPRSGSSKPQHRLACACALACSTPPPAGARAPLARHTSGQLAGVPRERWAQAFRRRVGCSWGFRQLGRRLAV